MRTDLEIVCEVGFSNAVLVAQNAILFQDEGVDLGSAGDIDKINFVGSAVTAAKSGGTLTVTITGGGGGGTWGSITGTLSNQTDLQTALNAKLTATSNLSDVANVATSRNNILPSQTSNSGKFLTTDGTNASWGTAGSGSGTVTTVSVVTANGVSGSVSNPTTTPAITVTLGAITPSSVNSVAISGSSTPTLAVTGTTTVSGANTGDQTISLTGDVTGSGTGSFAATIANSAVTLAKMANMATSSLIYRKTAGTGAPEVNTLATLKTDLGLTGTNSGDQTISITGDVTASGSTGSLSATVTKINGTTLSGLSTGILKNTTGTGVPSIAVSGTDYQAPLVSGTNIKTVNSTSLVGSGNVAVMSLVGSPTNHNVIEMGSGGDSADTGLESDLIELAFCNANLILSQRF